MITLAITFVLYWLPSLLAYHWRHRNRTAILITNFFLGWTIIAWIVILIWACTNNRETSAAAWG
jgi:Superinfection immunity protein